MGPAASVHDGYKSDPLLAHATPIFEKFFLAKTKADPPAGARAIAKAVPWWRQQTFIPLPTDDRAPR